MNITAKMVKELREKTGAGMMDCKKALSEVAGDIEKAVEALRERGLAAAAKKSGRVAAEGIIKTYIAADKKSGVILELNCETDFVAINEDFIGFSDMLAKLIAGNNFANVEEVLAAELEAGKTVQAGLTELIAKIGENMSLRRFEKYSVTSGVVKDYIHGGGRIGALVELSSDKESEELDNLAKELCMQIAAANPACISEADVDQEELAKEKEVLKAQALNEGKPEKIVDKMVEGRIKKYLKEICLLDQVWVKDGDLTIAKLLEAKSKELGATITVNKFVRFERGEGIEKAEENFAEEVAKMGAK
ncbi:translation elongation factor Ts [uncultured Clostridium sp.]|jgi:elongation factor Ts|uniref:translation elongation factor Ts n=1 Tax=uncultured Clostridium sp. TaxID=59620 RepID=UPI00261BDD11|nr:translation elongation factor Ts [uncultured Clostridium sp.]